MTIQTVDPHASMKDQLVAERRKLQEQRVQQQTNAQPNADAAATDLARNQAENSK